MKRLVRRSVSAVLSAGFGIVGGLAVSWIRPGSLRGDVAKNEPPQHFTALQRAVAWDIGERPPDPVLPALEPSRVTPPPAAVRPEEPRNAGSPPPVPEPEDPDEEMREGRRFHEERHEAALHRHRNEPNDPRWAAATEAKLEEELAKVGDRSKFTVVRADCRTTTCVTLLEWSSYGNALRSYGDALRQIYTVNCGQEVLLPQPTNLAAPYQASMIFDCESWRAAGN